MPELPEVETVMRGLETVLTGKRIAQVRLARGDLRFPFPPDFAKRIEGRLVLRLMRRAKYILAFLEGGEVLILHLGMSGRFTIIDAKGRMQALGEFYDESAALDGGRGPHDHVVFTREDGLRVVYTDPRRFGLMDLVGETSLASHKLLAEIGVEPLGNEFDALYLAEALRGKKAPLKAALLDQRLIAGLGKRNTTRRSTPRHIATSARRHGFPQSRGCVSGQRRCRPGVSRTGTPGCASLARATRLHDSRVRPSLWDRA